MAEQYDGGGPGTGEGESSAARVSNFSTVRLAAVAGSQGGCGVECQQRSGLYRQAPGCRALEEGDRQTRQTGILKATLGQPLAKGEQPNVQAIKSLIVRTVLECVSASKPDLAG